MLGCSVAPSRAATEPSSNALPELCGLRLLNRPERPLLHWTTDGVGHLNCVLVAPGVHLEEVGRCGWPEAQLVLRFALLAPRLRAPLLRDSPPNEAALLRARRGIEEDHRIAGFRRRVSPDHRPWRGPHEE